MNKKTAQGFCLAVALCAVGSVQAQYQTCPNGFPKTTPDVDFFDGGNGTALHLPTGLIWKRCSEGQTWSNGFCSFEPVFYTWQQALDRADAANAGAEGTQNAENAAWRLPNVNELQSIIERGCAAPSINLAWFPGTPGNLYWGGSPVADVPVNAWLVGFYHGGVGGHDSYDALATPHAVRLVRGGRSATAFDLLAPRSPTVTSLTPGDTKIIVSFTAATNGPLPVTFLASCTNGSMIRGVIGVGSPIVVNNLTNGAAYTCSVNAANPQGISLASATTLVVPQPTVPDAPTLLRLVSGNRSIKVMFAPSLADGGSAITNYRATCIGTNAVPHGQAGMTSPLVVPGLVNGLSYSCSVIAHNAIGSSAASTVSTQVAKRPVDSVPIISILLGD
ncbi:MAG: DUF1566 domain-containing protein [Comamonadaceae bacterium]|nr:DUF1566 domain-containing protein [Comamonadaceae bacterium]